MQPLVRRKDLGFAHECTIFRIKILSAVCVKLHGRGESECKNERILVDSGVMGNEVPDSAPQ